MIVHKPTGRDATKSHFARLAVYITREFGKADKGNEILFQKVTNCQTDNPQDALKEIEAVQAKNTRTTQDRTYHFIVSFPREEKPTAEQLEDIEQQLCESIGYGKHQRISALHNDTDHLHLHVAVNKIDPETFNIIQYRRDFNRLNEKAGELEVKYNLKRVCGLDKPSPDIKLSEPAKTLESQTATQSFQSWVATHKPAIMEALKAATDWQALHKALAHYDLTIRKNANGLSISSRTQKAYMKASDFDRSTTIKKLEDRYGAYQEPDQAIKALPPALQYKPLPKQPPQGGLWETFQAAMVSKQAIREANNEARKQSMDALYKAYTHRREMIKNDKVLNKRSKQATYQLLKQTYQNERKAAANVSKEKQAALLEQYPFRNWQDFLMNESLKGNEAALKTLRSNKVAEKLTERFAVWGEQAAKAALLFPALKPKIAKNGDILYRVGTINIRDNGRLHTNDDSGEAISLTLRLARQKYGNVLDVQGTDTFKRQVVECAAAEQMPITFTDPLMEQYRQQLAQLAQQATQPQTPAQDQKQPGKPKDNDRGR